MDGKSVRVNKRSDEITLSSRRIEEYAPNTGKNGIAMRIHELVGILDE